MRLKGIVKLCKAVTVQLVIKMHSIVLLPIDVTRESYVISITNRPDGMQVEG
jgi:hypothetical protein